MVEQMLCMACDGVVRQKTNKSNPMKRNQRLHVHSPSLTLHRGKGRGRSIFIIMIIGLGLLGATLDYVMSNDGFKKLPGSEEMIVKGKNYLDPLDMSFADKLKKHRSLLSKSEEPVP